MNSVEAYRQKAAELRKLGRKKFFPWFNGLRNIDYAFSQGDKIFQVIILPVAEKWLRTLRKKKLLEIGYGGGVLLASASKFFDRVAGVDVHHEHDFVFEELKRRGVKNVDLYVSDGDWLPKTKYDFIFTFTVFGHLWDFKVLQNYLEILPQSLSKNGVAMLHFNRLVCRKTGQTLREIEEDFAKEDDMKHSHPGYALKDTSLNQVSMRVAKWKMIEECEKAGLTVFDSAPSGFDDPERGMIYGGQAFVVVGRGDETGNQIF
jgi:hypothetical protein